MGTATVSKTTTSNTIDWSVFWDSATNKNAVIDFVRGRSANHLVKSVTKGARPEARKIKGIPVTSARKRAESALDRAFDYGWRS